MKETDRKPKKQKTLYGRYDTYALPEDRSEEGTSDLFCGDAGEPAAGEPLRSRRLVELTGSGSDHRSGAGATGRKRGRGASEVQGALEKQDTPAPVTSTGGRTVKTAGTLKTAPTPTVWVGDTVITDIEAALSGEYLLVTLEGNTAEGQRLRQRIPLTAEQYAGMGLSVGSISVEEAARLTEAGQLCRAIRKGMELLGYGDLSVRRMVWKLTVRGADRETAAGAAAYLKEKGFLREESAAERRAEQGARKLWGPRRIRQDLMAQGYEEAAVQAAMEALSDPENPESTDYIANCATLIRKKYGEVPADRQERQRMLAGLTRLGYTYEQVREAARMVSEGDEP